MIIPGQLHEVGLWLIDQKINESPSEEMLQQLRQRFDGIHFTWCMDDDVGAATPVYEHATFNLYLIDSSNECLCFSQDMDSASGIVVAEIEPELEAG